jgi:tripartite-type tricarboxylate transporter receptor subunit TctC
MLKDRRYRLALVIGLAFMISVSSSQSWAAEEKYPSGQIEIICGMVAGGPADLLTRAVARGFEKYMGATVVPGNKVGGGGIVATTAVANSKPDGRTLAVLAETSMLTAIALGRATYSLADLRSIGQIALFPNVLAVRSDSEWKTFQQFLDHARKNPGMKYAHPGIGSTIFLKMENMNKFGKMGMVGLPFKGDPEIVAALLGGHVPVGGSVMTNFKSHIDSGELRVLLSFEPPELLGLDPKIPTVESVFGKALGDIDVPFSLVAPSKTPDSIIKVLVGNLQKVVKDPEFVSTLQKIFLIPAFVDGKTVNEKNLPEKMERIKQILARIDMPK